jgi:hypothetical protein
MDQREIEEFEEKNLKDIDTWDHTIGRFDQNRKARGLKSVDHLKEDILSLRMAYHDHDLNGFRKKIKDLQDQRTLILQAPMNKEEFLARVKEIVHDNKKSALNELVLMPLMVKREGNLLPEFNTERDFPERHLWSLLYLTITDEDLEGVVEALPGTGLSAEERKAQVAKINTEITKLTEILKSKREDAAAALKALEPK